MAELPPTYARNIRFVGLNENGDMVFRGQLRVPQEVIDAVGGIDKLERYLESAVQDAMATNWPFDGPESDGVVGINRPEETTPFSVHHNASPDSGSPNTEHR